MDQKSTGSKKLEQYISKLEERREIEAMNNYNPFGRGGAGAPLRDANGYLINRKIQNSENPNNFSSQQYNRGSSNFISDNLHYRIHENIQKNYYTNHDAKINKYDNDKFNVNPNFPTNQNFVGDLNPNNFNRNLIQNNSNNHFNYPSLNDKNSQPNNLNAYYNQVANLNSRNNLNNQYLSGFISNFNIGQNENFINTNSNRTLSANNRILDQNKKIYSQNIINDINQIYEESSKIQNYNLQSDMDHEKHYSKHQNQSNNNNSDQYDQKLSYASNNNKMSSPSIL